MEIVPATVDRFEHVSELLGSSGEAGCWCQAWRGLDSKPAGIQLDVGTPRIKGSEVVASTPANPLTQVSGVRLPRRLSKAK